MGASPLNLATFLDRLLPLPASGRFVLGLSGGMDSVVLLHLLAVTREQHGRDILAVHMHHGLQTQADDWVRHCNSLSEQFSIPIQIEYLSLSIDHGDGIEAAARDARYAAFARIMQSGDLLLTAHHQSDQAETLLLQLLRGSSSAGLAAMPEKKPFSSGWHLRPLLFWSRDDIEHYATQQALIWVNDPSNNDNRFDRNFLRNQIVPLIKQRWSSADHTLHRASQLQAEQLGLLHELARLDREHVNSETAGCLSVDALKRLSSARCRNVIRQWLHEKDLPMPSQAVMQQLLNNVLPAKEDAQPLLSWQGVEVRRYRDDLYAFSSLSEHDATTRYEWPENKKELSIEHLGFILYRHDLADEYVDKDLIVAFRQGGETIKLRKNDHSKSLKDLFQEKAIPPWERDRIPLIYCGAELIKISGFD